jgi:hypothetical protein
MLKLIIVPRTRPGMTRQELQTYLEQVHGPLCMRHISEYFRRYVHHYVTDAAVDPVLGMSVLADRDDLTIDAFEDMAALAACTSSKAYRELIRPDEDKFAVREGSLFMASNQEVVLKPEPADVPIKLFHLRRVADGADPAKVSEAWCERVRRALERDGAAISGYIHNRNESGEAQGGAQPAYDAVDEIGIQASGGELRQLGSILIAAQDGLFDPAATAAMVTRPKVFVA